MLSRWALPLLLVFWVSMSVLLWHTEFGQGRLAGTVVSPGLVWDKILTSPDTSSLVIFREGERIGFCHLVTAVSEETDRPSGGPWSPVGRVQRVAGYRVQMNGNVGLGDSGEYLRFDCDLSLNEDRSWNSIALRLVARPHICEIESVAGEETLTLTLENAGLKTTRTIRFADLANGSYLLSEFLGPAGSLVPGAVPLPVPFADGSISGLTKGFEWQARTDTVPLGNADSRVYRLEARLLEGYSLVVIVSRAGEVMRIDLPGDLRLVNDLVPNL